MTYLYLCKALENSHGEFEVEHSIKDVLTECPKCKEEGKSCAVERLIAAAAPFQLMGGGWSPSGYSGS